MKQTRFILIESILIDKLPINGSVLSLVDYIRAGGNVPPIKLQASKDGGYKLRDGRHRVCAYKLLGFTEIEATFKEMDLLSFEIELKDLLLKFNAKLTIIDNKLMVNGKSIEI